MGRAEDAELLCFLCTGKNIGKESTKGTDRNIPFLPLCPNSHSRPTKSEEIELNKFQAER